MPNYNIVLADDHALIRKGIKKIIDEKRGFAVVGEASNKEELFDVLEKEEVNLILLDVTLDVGSGIDFIPEITDLYPEIKILILTMHKRKMYLVQAMAAGAHGYLLKEDSDIELLDAIEAINKGETYISNPLWGDYRKNYKHIIDLQKKAMVQPLSKREIDVIKLIADGQSNKEIAANLEISIRTVENHRLNISKKTGINKTAEFVKYAIQFRHYDLPY